MAHFSGISIISTSHQLKKRHWTPSDKTFWIRAWANNENADEIQRNALFYDLTKTIVNLELWLYTIDFRQKPVLLNMT